MNTHITAIKTTLPNSRKKKKKDILPSYQTTQTNHKREESVRRKREWVSATRTGLRNCSVLNELKPTKTIPLRTRNNVSIRGWASVRNLWGLCGERVEDFLTHPYLIDFTRLWLCWLWLLSLQHGILLFELGASDICRWNWCCKHHLRWEKWKQ